MALNWTKSELDNMDGFPSAVTNESLFRIPFPAKISCHVPEQNMTKVVTRDMASPDWLKWRPFVCFRS